MKLTIESLSNLGAGITTQNNEKIFVPGTLPGEEVLVEITQKNSKFTKAEVVQLITPSEDRVAAPCPHYDDCGGCSLQHLSADLYLAFKTQIYHHAVARAGFDTA